jgi:hypothetical protein
MAAPLVGMIVAPMMRIPRRCAASISVRYPLMSDAAVTGSPVFIVLMAMSLMPSRTITLRAPG